ncbi:MAG: right-handed parallel beta-helix repeat-containing protein [Flavobacteriales bacterium]
MARKRRGSKLFRWLLCIGLPIGLLFGAFRTGWYQRVGNWPLGIRAGEVAAYAGLFDRRDPGQQAAEGEVWSITTAQYSSKKKRKKRSDADWRMAAFQAEGYSDSVEVRRVIDVEGAWEVRFPKDNYFKAQRRCLLIPADDPALLVDQACAMAKELGLAVPERERVRVGIDGDPQAFVAEEHIDEVFLDKRGYSDAVVFKQGFSSLHPEHWRPDTENDSALAEEILFKQAAIMAGTGDVSKHIDLDAAAAWLIMCDVERRRDPIMEEAVFAFDRQTDRIVPLYRPGSGAQQWRSAGMAVANVFSALLARPDFRERMEALRKKIAERDSIPTGSSRPLSGPVQLAWLQDALPSSTATTSEANGGGPVTTVVSLATIAQRMGGTASGDTLRFVRGKYNITEDVITPPNSVVILEKGTRWFIAPGKRVEVNGSITANGTGPNPVFIRPGGDGPHGGVIVNGVEGSRCAITGLQMSGGGATSMLDFRNTDVQMTKCILSGAAGGPLVSVQRGNVHVSGCAFLRTDGDGLRLLNADGKVEATSLMGSADQVKGSGVSILGGKILVNECRFSDLPQDAIQVSNGAEVFVFSTGIEGCGSGVAALDGANVSMSNGSILGTGAAFRAARTQQHRKGGSIFYMDLRLDGNKRDRDVDAVSKVTAMDAIDPKVWAAFGLEPVKAQ